MVATAIQFTGRVGYVTDTGLTVHRVVGDTPRPWGGGGEAWFTDDEVTEVTDTQGLLVGERVHYRRTSQTGIVRQATWINQETGWCYTVQVLNGTVLSGWMYLERLTVRVGDFIEGHRLYMNTRHRGRVAEVVSQPFSRHGTIYRLDMTGQFYYGGKPLDPIVSFDRFVYPLVGE